MRTKTRKSLFIIFTLLFVIFASAVALYANGFAIDLKNLKINKTGAIYLEFTQRNWNLFINNRLTKTDPTLLSGGVLLRNILPKSYSVQIDKPGYQLWTKVMSVKPALVARAIDLFLIPSVIRPDTILKSAGVENFWISESGIIYSSPNEELYYIYDERTVPLRGSHVLTESANSAKVITYTQNSPEPIYYLYDKRSPDSFLNLNALFANLESRSSEKSTAHTIEKIIPHAFDAQKWIIQTDEGLYIIDESKLEFTRVANGIVTALRTAGNYLYYYKKSAGLFRFDFILKTNRNIMEPLAGEFVLDIALGTEKNMFLRTNEGTLYAFILNSDATLKKLAHDVSAISVSGNGRQLAYTDSDGKLTIYFLKDYFGLVHKTEGSELQLRLPDMESIKKIEWYKNSNYIIAVYENTAMLVELDEQDKVITYELPRFDTSFFYDYDKNYFYFSDNQKLHRYSLE